MASLHDAKGSQLLRGRLNSLVQLRHSIAHGGGGATEYAADVQQFIDNIMN